MVLSDRSGDRVWRTRSMPRWAWSITSARVGATRSAAPPATGADIDAWLERQRQTRSVSPVDHDTMSSALWSPGAPQSDAALQDGISVTAWYERLREQYRPDRLEVLLIGESPPDPGVGERRFFYAPTLRIDNLCRGVAQTLYGNHPEIDRTDKPAVLRRLQADGFWLIDAVDQPVKPPARTTARGYHRRGGPSLSPRCRQLSPRRGHYLPPGGGPASRPSLRDARVRVLHAAVPVGQLVRPARRRISPGSHTTPRSLPALQPRWRLPVLRLMP
jgi:hypothetical protein